MAHGTRTARASADDAYDVVVVGGGIAGLTAAHALRDRDVLLLEADDRVGGRIYSEPRGDVWLNFGAHVFAGPESASGRLFEELGVEAAPVPGRLAAVSLNGKLVATGPVESFPLRLPLPLRSRLALVRAGLRLRLAVRRYADVAAAPCRRERSRAAGTHARLHGRPLLRGLCRRAARGRRRALPRHADPLLRRARGACRRIRGRLLPPRLEPRCRTFAQHRRGLGRRHRGARRASRRPRAYRGPRDLPSSLSTASVRVHYEDAARQPSRHRTFGGRRPRPPRDAGARREACPRTRRSALEAIPYGPYVVAASLTRETRADALGRAIGSRRRSAPSGCSSTSPTCCASRARRAPRAAA